MVEELTLALATWRESTPELGARAPDIDLESLDPKAAEMLRALGYVD